MKQFSILLFSSVIIFGCNSEKKPSSTNDAIPPMTKSDSLAQKVPKPINVMKWPNEEQTAFMKSCILKAEPGIGKENANTYCDCMLQKIMVAYPDVNDATNLTIGETDKWGRECFNTFKK